MGLPALRDTRVSRHDIAPRPHLRVVSPSGRTAPKRNTAGREDRCRDAFRIVLLGMLAVSVFGLGRVAMSAQAIEASIDSSRLRSDIKAEQLTADQLEVDKSSLMTPSRIQAIAGTTMKMSEAVDVTFITISDAEETPADASTAREPVASAASDVLADNAVEQTAEETPLQALLSKVMDMAAGEAQVLLVGDIGLASSR